MSKKIYIILLLICFALFVASFFVHPRGITCDGIRCIDVSTDFEKSILNGSLLNAKKTSSLFLSKNPRIETFSTKVDLLGNVSVLGVVKTSDIAFVTDGESIYSLYTKKGEFSGTSSFVDVPIITVLNKFSVDDIPFTASLGTELFKLLPVVKAYIKNDSLYIETVNNISGIYPLKGDLDFLLGQTVVAFSQLNGESEKFNIIGEDGIKHKATEIDFRFERPVVR